MQRTQTNNEKMPVILNWCAKSDSHRPLDLNLHVLGDNTREGSHSLLTVINQPVSKRSQEYH
jgi:hypothetical protein